MLWILVDWLVFWNAAQGLRQLNRAVCGTYTYAGVCVTLCMLILGNTSQTRIKNDILYDDDMFWVLISKKAWIE